nr:hypothetical protein Itr_chr06CG18310 [Ipomoea trifida]
MKGHRCLSLKEEEVGAEELLRRAYQHRLPPLSLLSLSRRKREIEGEASSLELKTIAAEFHH